MSALVRLGYWSLKVFMGGIGSWVFVIIVFVCYFKYINLLVHVYVNHLYACY